VKDIVQNKMIYFSHLQFRARWQKRQLGRNKCWSCL